MIKDSRLLAIFLFSLATTAYAEASQQIAGEITVNSAEAPQEIVGAITVNAAEAKGLYDGGAVFIDVRDRGSWGMGHIKGAVSLDFNADEFAVLYLSKELDRTTPLVFYTNSPLELTSAMASAFASVWGYLDVYYYRAGYFSWIASDYP